MSLSQRSQNSPAPHGSQLQPLGAMVDYSTKRITRPLLDEVARSLKSIDGYGSVELYVQNSMVTQITVRNIKKTNGISAKKRSAKG